MQRAIYAEFVERLAERTRLIRPGMPFDPASHIGPQASARQLSKTLDYIEIGKREGARLVVGGGRPADPTLVNGYFVEPTIFADVDNRSRLAQEEIFGPVLAVIPFDTEEEVVRAGQRHALRTRGRTMDAGTSSAAIVSHRPYRRASCRSTHSARCTGCCPTAASR